MDQKRSKSYTLFNKRLNRQLTHPKVGLWFTNDLKEAEEMLQACKEYVQAIGVPSILEDFEIMELSSEGDVH
jgi:hypothetical protein